MISGSPISLNISTFIMNEALMINHLYMSLCHSRKKQWLRPGLLPPGARTGPPMNHQISMGNAHRRICFLFKGYLIKTGTAKTNGPRIDHRVYEDGTLPEVLMCPGIQKLLWALPGQQHCGTCYAYTWGEGTKPGDVYPEQWLFWRKIWARPFVLTLLVRLGVLGGFTMPAAHGLRIQKILWP